LYGWYKNICSFFFKLSQDMQKLDLEAFDNGTEYDMEPFLDTIGRLSYYFNAVQRTQMASFLFPAFEHLEVITLHAKLVSSPFTVFLEFSPIEQLWKHMTVIKSYIKNVIGGAHYCARFVCLFAFFNIDSIALNLLEGLQDQLTAAVKDIRSNMLTYIQEKLAAYTDKDSILLRITEQNRLDQIFDPKPFLPQGDADNMEEETRFRTQMWQLKEFLKGMPGVINFNGQDIEISEFVTKHLTEDLGSFLFKKPSPDAQWLDSVFSASCQYMWGIYTILGASFPTRLLTTRYQNSIYPDQTTFLQQISLIRQDCANAMPKRIQIQDKKSKKRSEKDSHLEHEFVEPEVTEYTKDLKLSKLFEDRLRAFISHDYLACYYLPHSRAFENFAELKYYAVEFASQRSMRKMIDSLGLHVGFNLDRILIAEIAKSMGTMYQYYIALGKTVNSWYGSFRTGGDEWAQAAQSPELGMAAEEIVRLGAMLVLRDMLRTSMHEAVKQSAPGMIDLIRPAYMRTIERLSEKEDLMMEMISAEPTFFFIKMALDTMGIEKTSDSIQFFFFLALLLIYPKWEDAVFVQDHEIITHNLHLIPVAIDAFINVLSSFCQAHDEKIVASGMQFYFTVLQHIVQKKRTNEELLLKSASSFVILADLFPKYLRTLEYGRISHSFPNSVVSEAYRIIESSGQKMTISVKIMNQEIRDKKKKKDKKKH